MNSKKIKIGVLSKDIANLRAFEYKIFDEIFKNKDLELSVLILDGRKKNKLSFKKKFTSLFFKKNLISRILLNFQEIIEKIIFKNFLYYPEKKLVDKIKSLNKIYLHPKKRSYFDVFSKNDCIKINEFNVELIIRTEFNIIRGEILSYFKYGIWSFHHGDNRVNRGGPPCFWELIEKHENVGVTLQKLTPELDGGKIIDRGSYNPHWSWYKTKHIVYDSSITLLTKNLKLLTSGKLNLSDSPSYNNKIYKYPSLRYSLQYIIYFYKKLFIRVFEYLISSIYLKKYNHWSLAFDDGLFFNSTVDNLIRVNTPKNEFWADPFLIERNKIKYIFFENYNYGTKIGKISCGQIKGKKIINIQDVLVKDYHLSYPFIYEQNNEIFMIPESSANNRLEVYKCNRFPDSWSLYSTAFNGEKVKDCNIHKDQNDNLWIFLNKKYNNSDDCSDLYIYKIDSLKFKKIYSHKLNPVITDSKVARNAGPLFYFDNKLFRPSQININGQYGVGININQISNLTLDEYNEQLVRQYTPNFDKKTNGLHHLHFKDDFFVVDIRKRNINII